MALPPRVSSATVTLTLPSPTDPSVELLPLMERSASSEVKEMACCSSSAMRAVNGTTVSLAFILLSEVRVAVCMALPATSETFSETVTLGRALLAMSSVSVITTNLLRF